MKIKVSDYIANYLVDNDIVDVFTITGGGAMHLNDSLGHKKGMHCYYQHHEQACAIAAEAYARIHNKLALVCVTTGPGGTNAITGVVGGWLDSIPMLIISGQVRSDTMAKTTGLNLRSMGDQEFDIISAISCMTKYSELVLDPNRIKYCLAKAITISKNGRPGPCWLDIPLDVQGAFIETDELEDYNPQEYLKTIPTNVTAETADIIIQKINDAKRPILYVGNGIRLSGGYDGFLQLYKKLKIPVVTGWDSIDLIPDEDPLFAGRAGSLGTRSGNFAVQNSDLILSIGNRLCLRQTSFNWKEWAKHAYIIMEDVDENELKKPTLHVDMPLYIDAKALLDKLNESNSYVTNKNEWVKQCIEWKMKYPVVQKQHYENYEYVNPYSFM